MFLSGMHIFETLFHHEGTKSTKKGKRPNLFLVLKSLKRFGFASCPSCLRGGCQFLFPAYILNESRDIDPDRAGPHAASAAGAEGLAELVVVVLELVHDPVAIPLGLYIPRVVAGGVIGELAEAAGVPVLAADAFPFGPFVVDIKAVAGRADEGAGAAADTPLGDLLPEVALEVVLQPLPDLLQVELFHGGLGERQGFTPLFVGKECLVPLHQQLPLVGDDLAAVLAPFQRQEEDIRAF